MKDDRVDSAAEISHAENATEHPKGTRTRRADDDDTALALFNGADDLDEQIDPEKERRLVRKIDMMILP